MTFYSLHNDPQVIDIVSGLLMSISTVWLVNYHYKTIQTMFSKETISVTVYLADIQKDNLDDEPFVIHIAEYLTNKHSSSVPRIWRHVYLL